MIDLHTHSRASDGTETPSELLAAAARAGLDTVAITDHDSTAGWAEASAAAAREGVALVRGVEVSTHHSWVSIHVLGYLIDPAAPGLLAEMNHARASRETRLAKMVGLMSEAGVPLTVEDVQAVAGPGATLGRPHIADALVAKGLVSHRDEAFATYLHGRSEFYVAHYAPEAVDAIRLIVEAGGVAVMAHPFAGKRGRVVGDDVIEELAAAGLAGLEVDHRDHDDAERVHAGALADRLGLIRTGSSDYHGAGKLNRIGEHTTTEEALKAIEDRATSATEVLR